MHHNIDTRVPSFSIVYEFWFIYPFFLSFVFHKSKFLSPILLKREHRSRSLTFVFPIHGEGSIYQKICLKLYISFAISFMFWLEPKEGRIRVEDHLEDLGLFERDLVPGILNNWIWFLLESIENGSRLLQYIEGEQERQWRWSQEGV